MTTSAGRTAQYPFKRTMRGRPSDRAHAPPTRHHINHVNPDAALAGASLHR